MLENAMVLGAWPYDTPFTVEPDVECPVCHVGMFYGDELYSLDGDWMCKDCIHYSKHYIAKLHKIDILFSGSHNVCNHDNGSQKYAVSKTCPNHKLFAPFYFVDYCLWISVHIFLRG